MPRLILIHGNSVGIKFPMRDRLTKYASFSVFEPMIDAGEAILYAWHYVNEDFDLFQSLNPFEFRRQYMAERKYCHSHPARQKLGNFLRLEQPEKIVCHSMGSYLLLNTINSFGLPASVKFIHLAQGDFDHDFKLINSNVLDRLRLGDLKIFNYYCPWDQMLLLSVAANGKTPGGLVGAKQKYFTNKLFATTNTANIHHATVNSQKFLQTVLN